LLDVDVDIGGGVVVVDKNIIDEELYLY